MKKKFAKIVLLIILVCTLAIFFTACDGEDFNCGIVITKGEQGDVLTLTGNITAHPMWIGYYVQVAKCDNVGNIILDDNGNIITGWFRTSEYNEFVKYKVGGIWVKDINWQHYIMSN